MNIISFLPQVGERKGWETERRSEGGEGEERGDSRRCDVQFHVHLIESTDIDESPCL